MLPWFVSMNSNSRYQYFCDCDISIHGVVGGAWLAPNIDELWKDPTAREALMKTVRMLDQREDIIGLSTHILGISKE